MIILEIAAGIILAVLFFRFLHEVLIIFAGLIGIALFIGFCVGIYSLYVNYYHDYPLFFILPACFIAFAIISHYVPYGIDEDNVVYVIHLPAGTSDVNKQRVKSYLLKNDDINCVFSNKDNEEITINYNLNKISDGDIKRTINQILSEK